MKPKLVILGDDKMNPRALRVAGASGDLLAQLKQVPGFNYTSRDPYNFAKSEGEPQFPPSFALARHLIKTFGCEPNSDVQRWGAYIQERHKNALTMASNETALSQADEEVEPLPFGFQNAGVRFLQRQRRTLLCDEMGLGKTRQMLLAAEPTIARGGRGLVITRKYLISQWITETLRWTSIDRDHIIDLGSPKHRKNRYEVLNERKGVLVFINWDALSGLDELLMSTPWDWVLADEAHNIKNRKAQRTQAFVKLANPVITQNLVLATGTPVEKSPADMFSLLQALYPQQFTSYWAFFTTFVDYFIGAGGTIINGPSNTELLHDLLKPFYIRRTRAEKLSHIKEPQIIEFPIPFEKEQAQLYQDVLDDSVAITDEETGEVLSSQSLTFGVVIAQMTKLRQAGVCPELIDPMYANINNAKVDAVTALVQDLENEHILLYTSFRRSAHNFAAAINRVVPGTATVYLSGEDQNIVTNFGKTSNGPRVLCTTVESLGEGSNLQAARVIIFADLPWSGTRYRQAVGRIVRPGQEGQPLVYHLIGPLNLETKKMHPDSIDAYISKMHKQKAKMFSEVVVMRSFLDQVANRQKGRVEL